MNKNRSLWWRVLGGMLETFVIIVGFVFCLVFELIKGDD